MSWARDQRFKFIHDTLKDRGYINREDLRQTFMISHPQASIDFRNFLSLYPRAMHYNPHTKRYEKGAPSVLLRDHR